jgi:hypothetical protein
MKAVTIGLKNGRNGKPSHFGPSGDDKDQETRREERVEQPAFIRCFSSLLQSLFYSPLSDVLEDGGSESDAYLFISIA